MMTSSHREIFHFVAANMMLYIGVVVGLNCNNIPRTVPFCSDKGVSGRQAYLSGIDNGTNGIGCNCSISLISYNQDPVNIEIKNVTTTSMCDYHLNFDYRNTSKILYSCIQKIHIHSLELKSMETVRLYMEPGTNNNAGFPLCLNISSEQGSQIKLQCTSKSPTTTSSPTSLKYMTSSTRDGMSTISDASAVHSTSLNPGTGRTDGTSYTTVISNTSGVFPSTTEQQPNNDDSGRLIGIIFGSIVGVLVAIVLVIIVVCLVKRRQKKLPYETPLEPQDRPHNYLNAVVTPNNNANGYNSQITNPGNQGMIYLENDLYKSIDEDEPAGRRGGNHEGMIYLENDLYISGNETDDVNQDAENSVPHQPVEYAVINKTAKKSSSSNGASMGHTVGPRGDEYTLVLKK